ncbi:hypothetical protein FRACYDRAFT_264055 [Fragilariopsis cylindrus CCMP1102]|uniref:Uncharacterized protein n=1 Tax=Fragilariopsis cylindrus CCMP1102 TaxID=635003 RepID=A0A1E7EVB0_9STRA|nr:hypothetical protein FRACYDRAFT_264055 [Fragilariopsis cylindrus CCMP1102]|eukprot:OEU09735.1 hypothetical protein FRACYDRAFT_264055 [Fragilariopsis cylindrus CCMP1102]
MDTAFSSNDKRRRCRGGKKEEDDEDAKLVSSKKKKKKKKKKRRILLQIDPTKSSPEEVVAFEVINTTLNRMETIITYYQQKKGNDCDEDRGLIEDLSDTIKGLYLSSHFSSTKFKQIFYLAFYKLHGIPRLLSILKMITCTRNDLRFYNEDGFKELDVKKYHEYCDTYYKGMSAPLRKIGRAKTRYLAQTRKRPISKAYIFLFLYKIMNWEDLHRITHGYDMIKDACIKMQEEFIEFGGIQLLIDTNTANIHYDRMTDLKLTFNILSMITFQLNPKIQDYTKQCMFNSVLDALTLLCKFPDDQYVISTFNSILNFLNRFIHLYTTNVYAAQQFKEHIVPILSKANKNPNGSYRENINADLVNKFMVTYDTYFPNENVEKNTNES